MKALEFYEQLGNPLGMAKQYGNLGILYKEEDLLFEKAFTNLIQGFMIADSLGAVPMKNKFVSHLNDLKEKVGEEQYNKWLKEFEQKEEAK